MHSIWPARFGVSGKDYYGNPLLLLVWHSSEAGVGRSAGVSIVATAMVAAAAVLEKSQSRVGMICFQ